MGRMLDRYYLDDPAKPGDPRAHQGRTSQARVTVWEFITETARLTADAFEHSLERPETLPNVYAIMFRIRLVASVPVVEAALAYCQHIVDMHAQPNLTK